MGTEDKFTERRFYGRRRGRSLRQYHQGLMQNLLPGLLVRPNKGQRLCLENLFPNKRQEIWLEVGFGGGEHLAHQAALHPNIGFIGCEPFINGVAKLLEYIDVQKLQNVCIYPHDAHDILSALEESSLGRAFILFPDPWPKKRHNHRRFINQENLDLLAKALKDGAELRLASDDVDYIRWMLFHTCNHPDFEWIAKDPADWRTPPQDWIKTRYQQKAEKQGKSCVFLTFRRKNR